MHNYIQMNTTLTQITILNTFIKSDILTLPLTPPKTHIKIFKNEKLNLQRFVPSEIWTNFYIHTPYFLNLQIWTFQPHEPKKLNFLNSFLEHYPQPKINQKSPKDPKLILILNMKLLYTFFW